MLKYYWGTGSAKVGLFDLKKKDASLKLQWVATYFKNVEIRALANTNFKDGIQQEI